ncbi:MAG: hypothetical protein CVV41_06465 [Candidatus Riflebacteria bacterium HGW-Riflebacteria-1]|jgi:hypothetical protein|nr:MAG: hypothetical protein CVV41_06465 [Candidatus Riflebacteria bacterium HGW-Riflebacteria-1]
MKRIEILLLLAIILVAGGARHYYYNTYARPDLPENIAPPESLFAIKKAAPSQILFEDNAVLNDTEAIATATDAVSYKTRPTTADLMLAKKLAADLALWPLNKNPDFWLLKAHLRRHNWSSADRAIDEALKKPQPWHLRFAFAWLAARIKFIIWLEQKPDAISGQVRDALVRSLGGFPSIFAGRQLAPGVGYLASDSAPVPAVPAQSGLVASASEALLSVVNGSEHFARWFVQSRVKSQKYCQKLCRSANMLLEPPEIFERYAEVDYIYQARLHHLANTGVASRVDSASARAELEKNWSLPGLPACSGHLLMFSRNQWRCALHESLAIELVPDPEDYQNEAWSAFILCNPHLNSDTFD